RRRGTNQPDELAPLHDGRITYSVMRGLDPRIHLSYEEGWIAASSPAMTDSCSLDHLVGAAEQRDWKRESERLRSLEVDHKLDFRRLLDRQVGGLLALENATDIDAQEAKRVRKARAIAHQATGGGKLAHFRNCRERMTRRERAELNGV